MAWFLFCYFFTPEAEHFQIFKIFLSSSSTFHFQPNRLSYRFRNGSPATSSVLPVTRSASGASVEDVADRKSYEKRIAELEFQLKVGSSFAPPVDVVLVLFTPLISVEMGYGCMNVIEEFGTHA